MFTRHLFSNYLLPFMFFQLETPTHPSVLQEHPYTRKVVPRLNDTGIASILFMRLHQQHVLEFDRHVDLDKMGPKTRKGYKSTYFGVNSPQLPTFLGHFYRVFFSAIYNDRWLGAHLVDSHTQVP